jgi:hypothetical protein
MENAAVTTLNVAYKFCPVLDKIWESRKGDNTVKATSGTPPPASHVNPVNAPRSLVLDRRRCCCWERCFKYCFVNSDKQIAATAAETP